MPNHSTRASELLRATSEGIRTALRYLELTFSVMVRYRGSTYPLVVLAIDGDYRTLLCPLSQPNARQNNEPMCAKAVTEEVHDSDEICLGKGGSAGLLGGAANPGLYYDDW